MTDIHPTAIVSPTAELGADVSVGPYVIVEDNVQIGDGSTLAARVSVKSGTRIGAGNQVYEGAVVGGIPQHLAVTKDMGGLIIGDGNIIRENATIHRAYVPENTTTLGNRNMVMINAHIAHDCQIADDVIMANNVMLAGHVEIGSRAYISGAVGVHQFCRIGRQAMIGGQARVTRDVPPFMTVDGISNSIAGLNLIGLRRSGMKNKEIRQLKEAYRIIFRYGLHWDEIISRLNSEFPEGPGSELVPFLEQAKRGLTRSRTRDTEDAPASTQKTPPKTPQTAQPSITVRFPDDEAAA